MPAAFFGHGSPMNALQENACTRAWRDIGRAVPRPRAILMVSAHWFVGTTAVTAMAQPRTIHDFHGFPAALFEVQYPAPGYPALAEEVADLVKPVSVGSDREGWGLDHGTWSVLRHAFPAADIPVVQLSINSAMPPAFHFELGTRLAELRSRGILIAGSGNVVHNLRAMDWQRPHAAFDWAVRFNDHVASVMSERPADALSLLLHPDYRLAAPTPEHFLPLLYLAGLAAAAGSPLTAVLPDEYAFGSLSMTCYTHGMRARESSAHSGPNG
jgi:4,5-DOPA dioxygenase extradiol